MKFNHLKINNMIGARHIDMAITAPITLFCGGNGAGKSSVQEAVRMAVSGITTRVKLKKDYPLIVADGAKTASAQLTTDEGTATITLPKHTHTLASGFERGMPDALPYVLDAQRFADLGEEARRTFLFALTNCTITEAKLRSLLADAGCEKARVEQALPLLKSITGFPVAAKFSAEKATEAKGVWRGLTGETWGSVKGEDWQAEKPEVDQEAIDGWQTEVARRQVVLAEAQQALGGLRSRQTSYANDVSRRTTLQARAGRVESIKAKQDLDTATLVDLEEKVKELEAQAGTAPKVGLDHDFARAIEFALDALGDDQRPSIKSTVAKLSIPFTLYVAKFGLPSNVGDPDALVQLGAIKTALETTRKAVQNNARDLNDANAAAEQLKEPAAPPVSDGDTQLALNLVTTSQDAFNEAFVELNAWKSIADKRASADDKTGRAAKFHTDVMEWDKIAKALGAEGIPAQILATALKPINTALRKSAMATGWRQAAINADMSITAEGRIYDLLCESERWRVDAMIAEAISSISGLGVLMLDRVDVLEPEARPELLLWLDGRAAEGAINSAFLFATLKGLPKGLPENITAVWLADGELVDQEQLEAA